ncbi:hypothetical protein [Streptomyces sp. NBC_01089]|uniref:MmyB family transcriptional regulator n=1 Tax=Streptomyces sp. NBC_01089 TaxID=2903747 RepID=UPI003866E47E|nr:hypothetical protein OG510_14895 [Streptomyces sp. NBC_01089]
MHARGEAKPEELRSGVRRMVEALTDVPAIAVGRRADILAWNPLAHALIAPHWPYEPSGRRPNFARLDFLEPDFARRLYPDWEAKARDDIAYLQVSVGKFPGDEGLMALIGELRELSGEFRRMWAEHPVSNCASVSRVYRHPEVGDMELTTELLRTPDDEGQAVTLFQAPAGSVSQERLGRLAELVSTTAG